MVGRQARREALFFAALFPTLITLSAARDTLVPGDRLEDGSSLVCSDGSFKLGFFTPGKSKFRFLGSGTTRSPSRRWSGWLTVITPCRTKPASYPSPSMAASPSPTQRGWSTGRRRRRDLPGQNFTSWKSDEDPGTGNCTFFLDSNGIPQIFLVQGTKRLWSSGPWVGGKFSGVPGMRSYGVYNFSFVSNADEAYYLFSSRIKSMLTRLVAQPNGRIERLVWMEGEGKWNAFYSGPKDRCDAFGYCGTFGVCDAKEFPMCSCLQGFEPKSPENGNLREGKDGCRRRTEVDCLNGTDGFVLVANVKLPDTSVAVVNEKMEAEECREACLRICSCTAYATGEMIDGSRSGCIIWSGVLTDLRVHDNGGQDLFVRLALADLGTVGESTTSFSLGGTRLLGIQSCLGSEGNGDSPTISSHYFGKLPTIINGGD
ncbi:unnamed protein product [Spirodela intermedia]|uniref:non-specific serine/threonine protein kinase n=1 Tax=Spirodela intermedia TaxID=51605 RepID=A0ABN7ECC1_SPIIN|nr:unnamed protein product [Spirodela intermedia]